MPLRNTRTALVAITGLSALAVLTGCAATSSSSGSTTAATSGAGSSSTGSSSTSTSSSSPDDDSSSTGSSSTGSSSPDDSSTAGTGGAAAASAGTYENGSYTEQGTYSSPGGQELISVDLTIASDTVKAVTVKTLKADPTATSYEAKFIGGISGAIVGKKVDDLHVTNVAGSSLTSQGFDDALTKIKRDAKA